MAESKVTQPAQQLPVDKIKPGKWQARRRFDPKDMADLRTTMADPKIGLLQAIGVKAMPDGTYHIVWGERRWRCARELGWKTIAAVVLPKDMDFRRASLAENLCHSKLAAVEEAHAYQDLLDEKGTTLEDVMRWFGRSRTHIENQLALLKLPTSIQEMNLDGRLSADVCRLLLRRCKTEKEMLAAIAAIGDSEGGTSKIRTKALERYLDRKAEEPHGADGRRPGKKRVARQVADDLNWAAMHLAECMEKWLGPQGSPVTQDKFARVWKGLTDVQRKELTRQLRVITERIRALNQFAKDRQSARAA